MHSRPERKRYIPGTGSNKNKGTGIYNNMGCFEKGKQEMPRELSE